MSYKALALRVPCVRACVRACVCVCVRARATHGDTTGVDGGLVAIAATRFSTGIDLGGWGAPPTARVRW